MTSSRKSRKESIHVTIDMNTWLLILERSPTAGLSETINLLLQSYLEVLVQHSINISDSFSEAALKAFNSKIE